MAQRMARRAAQTRPHKKGDDNRRKVNSSNVKGARPIRTRQYERLIWKNGGILSSYDDSNADVTSDANNSEQSLILS
jgi:hypothetical protein